MVDSIVIVFVVKTPGHKFKLITEKDGNSFAFEQLGHSVSIKLMS